jgi:hypothetical protein
MRQAEYGNNTIQVSYPLVPPKAEIDWALLYFRFVPILEMRGIIRLPHRPVQAASAAGGRQCLIIGFVFDADQSARPYIAR